ncbi:MAG: DUF669 domain-containing protein [Rhodospirillaceae bacterium]
MSNLGFTFDSSGIPPVLPFSPVPAGTYIASITETEVRVTRDGLGSYISAVSEILEGIHAGRKVYDRVTVTNASLKAVAFGNRKLSAMCRATGMMTITDTTDLHGIPFRAVVRVVPGDGEFGDSNTIAYLPLAG